jgi:hypothetical protein
VDEKALKLKGWLKDKLKGKSEVGGKKMKPTKDYPTADAVKRAVVAGLFRKMKQQGKNVKVGKGAAESIQADAAETASAMITKVMEGGDAFEVLNETLDSQPPAEQ